MKVGRIDIDPAEHRRLAVDVPIVADAADGARALAAAVKKKDDPARREAIAAAKAAALAQVSKAQPQYGYLEVIREALPDDGIVIDELTQVAYIGWYGYPVLQAAHVHLVRLLRHAGLRLSDGAGRQGRQPRQAGGVDHRRRRLPVRRLGPRDGGAVRHQPGHRGGEQRLLRQRAARPAADSTRAGIPARC